MLEFNPTITSFRPLEHIAQIKLITPQNVVERILQIVNDTKPDDNSRVLNVKGEKFHIKWYKTEGPLCCKKCDPVFKTPVNGKGSIKNRTTGEKITFTIQQLHYLGIHGLQESTAGVFDLQKAIRVLELL